MAGAVARVTGEVEWFVQQMRAFQADCFRGGPRESGPSAFNKGGKQPVCFRAVLCGKLPFVQVGAGGLERLSMVENETVVFRRQNEVADARSGT